MKRMNTVDGVRNSLDSEELYSWYPELELFGDPAMEQETGKFMLNWAPEYAFEIPSSSTGKYHPPDENNEGGNVLHTKRVFLAYEQLARSYIQQHKIDAVEYHSGQAAALLHDLFKAGWPSSPDQHVADHGVIVADLIEEKTALPQMVADCCRSHNGAWGEGDSPDSDLEQLVHMADMTVSPRWYYSDVYKPNEQLRSLGVGAIDPDELYG